MRVVLCRLSDQPLRFRQDFPILVVGCFLVVIIIIIIVVPFFFFLRRTLKIADISRENAFSRAISAILTTFSYEELSLSLEEPAGARERSTR